MPPVAPRTATLDAYASVLVSSRSGLATCGGQAAHLTSGRGKGSPLECAKHLARGEHDRGKLCY